jgi:hypothetical protein
MPNPTRPTLPTDPAPWLLGPTDLAAVLADDHLLDLLAAGERPDRHDPDPVARALALWLAEVDDAGGAR